MRWLVLLCASLYLSGCKVEIVPPETGSVRSESGTYVCTAEEPCLIEISDTSFAETFQPVADAGYAFTGWRPEGGTLCAGGDADCTLATAPIEPIEILLDSDEIYSLTPTFAPHDRVTFVGEWFGQLLGSNTTYNSEKEKVYIAIEGDRIEIVEERWSERTTCELEGRFEITQPEKIRAREAISGTYFCSSTEQTEGTFTGLIYGVTDHQLIVEVNATDSSGMQRTTVSALHRDDFVLSEAIHPMGEIAGVAFTAADLGDYKGNLVKSGPKCAAFPAEDSHVDISFQGSIGELTITTSVTASEDCTYIQYDSGPATVEGFYQCDNGEQGLWQGRFPTSHATPQGTVFSFEATRYGNFCESIHVMGWRKPTLNP